MGAAGLTSAALEVLVGRAPDDDGVRLLRASLAAARGEWSEVHPVLDGALFAGAFPPEVAHAWHLRGLASLHLGGVPRALADWRVGASFGPSPWGLDLAIDAHIRWRQRPPFARLLRPLLRRNRSRRCATLQRMQIELPEAAQRLADLVRRTMTATVSRGTYDVYVMTRIASTVAVDAELP